MSRSEASRSRSRSWEEGQVTLDWQKGLEHLLCSSLPLRGLAGGGGSRALGS